MTKLAKTAFLMIAVMALAFTTSANANKWFTAKQNEVFQTAYSVEGYLTEEMHAQFWTGVPKEEFSKDNEFKDAFLGLMNQISVYAMEYQREVWASVRLSLDAGRVEKTQRFEKARLKVVELMKGYPDQAHRDELLGKVDTLLEAAATRSPYHTKNGTMYITEDTADSVLAGLNGSLARVRKLMNPTWDDKPDEQVYDDAHFKILTTFPFARKVEQIDTENGGKAKLVTYSQALSADQWLAISFTHTGSRFADPAGATIRTVKGSLRGMGIEDFPVPTSSVWRGKRSAFGNGETVSGGQRIGGSVRVIEVPEHQGFISIIAVSAQGSLDAMLLRESAEASFQFTASE